MDKNTSRILQELANAADEAKSAVHSADVQLHGRIVQSVAENIAQLVCPMGRKARDAHLPHPAHDFILCDLHPCAVVFTRKGQLIIRVVVPAVAGKPHHHPMLPGDRLFPVVGRARGCAVRQNSAHRTAPQS